MRTLKSDAFYVTLKALFVLKYLNFCLDLLIMYKNGLVRDITLISKFMSLPGKQTIVIQKLPNI